MSDNWVVQALQSAFEIWNDKLTEIWSLITTTPQEFRGGDIWNAIVGINEGLKAVGYGLLVLVEAKSLKELALFVSSKLSTLEMVTGTQTSFVLKRYKEEGVIFDGSQSDNRLVVSP